MAFTLPEELGNKIVQAMEQQEAPVETPTISTPAEAPVINDATPTPEIPVNPEVVVESKEEDWDDEIKPSVIPETKPQETPISFDYSKLGKSIGFENITSEDQLISKVKSLQTLLDGAPDNLKKALELSKQGGDYLSYLGVHSVDYTSIDPVELFKSDLYNRVKMLNPNAPKEALDDQFTEALGSLSPIQQRLEGLRLQQGFVDRQKHDAIRIEREAIERKVKADTHVKSSIDKMEEVRGFKLKPHHKAAMYEYITSGELQKDLFSNESYNYEALAEIAFERKYGKKANDYLWKQAKKTTTKELVKELTNPQIEKPAARVETKSEEISPITLWRQKLEADANARFLPRT
jgi:hypothetical protein